MSNPDQSLSFERMFQAAVLDLAAINEALDLDPDDGGAVPILEAIAELKARVAHTEAAAMAATVPHEKLTHEIDMVLTDPDTKLSPGAVRALQWCRTWVSVPLQLAQAPVAGQPAEPSPAIVAAARALLLAADNMVETVNLMDPFKLLELDEDPHPPSTINAGSDELERTAGQLRAILAPKGDSNG